MPVALVAARGAPRRYLPRQGATVSHRPRWISLVLLALWGAAAQAQEVTGTVRAAGGRAPLGGAIVILTQPSGTRLSAALTDEAGRYRLRAPSPGTFSLRVDVVTVNNLYSL